MKSGLTFGHLARKKVGASGRTNDYEFVIFSREARKNQISQFICNEHPFGSQLIFSKDVSLDEEKARFEDIISSNINLFDPKAKPILTDIKNKIWKKTKSD